MSVLLHPKTAAQIDQLQTGAAGSVIFAGPSGLGKALAARELAARLNCQGDTPAQCANCRAHASSNSPDLIWIDRGDKASLGIEQVRSLNTDLALRPYRAGSRRVVVIDEAHRLTLEAQNALLKLLEEPPPATLIVLTCEHPESLLVTVRSRCRAVTFLKPGEAAVAQLLTNHHGLTGPEAARLAAAAGGLPGLAVTLAAQPAAAEAFTSLTADANLEDSRSLFERLLLAARLAAAGADLSRFGEALHHRVIARLQAGEIAPPAAAAKLDALERFRLALGAKVSGRVALERLMLELG